jgi:hypothetical protein
MQRIRSAAQRPRTSAREVGGPARRGPAEQSTGEPARSTASRWLYLGASALSFSILADSGIEHYRGGFHNRAMYIAPTVSALTLLAAGASAVRRRRHWVNLFYGAPLAAPLGIKERWNPVAREGGEE